MAILTLYTESESYVIGKYLDLAAHEFSYYGRQLIATYIEQSSQKIVQESFILDCLEIGLTKKSPHFYRNGGSAINI